MKQNEKKFSCDIASMLFAAGILGCLGLLLWDLESFIHMLPLVFLLGVLMLAVMAFRFYLCKKKRAVLFCAGGAVVCAAFAVGALLFFGGI